MRHHYKVEYWDYSKHAWGCRRNSTDEIELLVFTGSQEPCVGDEISISYTRPIVSVLEGVGLIIK